MNDLIAVYKKSIEELEQQEAELEEQMRQLNEKQMFWRRDAKKIKRKIETIEDELFDLRLAINMMRR